MTLALKRSKQQQRKIQKFKRVQLKQSIKSKLKMLVLQERRESADRCILEKQLNNN